MKRGRKSEPEFPGEDAFLRQLDELSGISGIPDPFTYHPSQPLSRLDPAPPREQLRAVHLVERVIHEPLPSYTGVNPALRLPTRSKQRRISGFAQQLVDIDRYADNDGCEE